MDQTIPLGGKEYCLWLAVMLLARGMDFLSTWIATPRLVLEANPIARKLGWRWGALFNLALAAGFATWPLAAVIISTTSLLVAARNFQSAWLMRRMGEEAYSAHYVGQLRQTPLALYFFCLLAQAGTVVMVGAALVVFSDWRLIPFGVGIGICAYAMAVVFYSALSLWLIRRRLR